MEKIKTLEVFTGLILPTIFLVTLWKSTESVPSASNRAWIVAGTSWLMW